MTDILDFNKNYTCCFSGHRILREDFNVKTLKKQVIKAIKEGYKYFLVGMAIGFDTVCFQLLEGLRKKYDIKIIACIPCENQDAKFIEKDRLEYQRMLAVADEKILISKEYTKYCMQKRNKFMVDNSSLLITYYKDTAGGTKNTVKYAKKSTVKIVYID